MCFSPQPHAIFWRRVLHILTWKCPSRRSLMQCFHIGTSKSGPELIDVFCAFSLENVTATCIFWFLLGPHDSAPAAFTSLLFDSPDTRIIEKTQHFATSLTFGACVSTFEWLYLRVDLPSSDLTSLVCFSSAFQLSILSEVTIYTNFLRPFYSRSASPKKPWGLASCHGNLSGRRSGEYSQHATLSVACTGDHDYCGLWRLLPHIFGRREGRERGRTRKTKKKRSFYLQWRGEPAYMI